MAAAFHRSLGARVYGVTVLVLVASLGSYAFLQARSEARSHREMVLSGARAALAIATEGLAAQLVVDDIAAIDQALLRMARLPGLLRIQVCELDGTVVSDARGEDGASQIAARPEPARLALPGSGGPEVAEEERALVVWHPILAGQKPIGWARATFDLAPLRATLRELGLRAVLLAAASILASLALLLWTLRRPLQAVRSLASFARDLDARKGEQVSLPPGPEEVDQLRDSLNFASEALARSERRLLEEAAQRRTLEAQLLQAQKMEALGVLAGGVAHDFNNLLTAMAGYANLAAASADSKGIQEDLEQILVATERAGLLTRGLLAFSRKQKTEIAPIDLNELLRALGKILKRLVGEDVELRVATAPEPVVVMADQGQMSQVVMNLVANARDAMPQGGVLSLSCRRERPPDGWPGGRAPDEAGCLAVSDTGAGIDEAVRRRIFEPFFTTKGLGRGTGLGLAIVHGIVNQHQGVVDVQSQVGAGTTFRVFLPLAGPEARVARAPAGAGPEEPGRGTVLLVEDDPQVNRVLSLTLEGAGYTVVSAENGRRGLEVIRDAGGRIDLLLSDVIMPEMNGVELLGEARRVVPGLPAILMSGYTADALERRGPLPPDVELLSKPVTPQVVRAKVRDLLAARR